MGIKDFDRIQYWSDPTTADEELRAWNNGKFFRFTQPEFYLGMDYGRRMVTSTLPRFCEKDWSFLELGCNTGKCLVGLYYLGFRNLRGVEINRHAIELGHKNFPELKDIPIICAPLEEALPVLPDFDVIYCNGVLMHIPYDLDWVFPLIAKKTRRVIMVAENEQDTNFHKFARNYKDVFEKLGWTQVEEEPGTNYPPLPASTIKRVFTK